MTAVLTYEATPESIAAASMTGNLDRLLDALQNWDTPADRLQRARALAAQATALVVYLEAITPASAAD